MNPGTSIASRHISHATPQSSGPAAAEPRQGGLGPVGLPKPRPYHRHDSRRQGWEPDQQTGFADPGDVGESGNRGVLAVFDISRYGDGTVPFKRVRSLADLESRGCIRRDRTIGGRGGVTTRYKIVILGQTGSTDVKGSQGGTPSSPTVGPLAVPRWDTKRSGEESDVQRTNVHSAARADVSKLRKQFPGEQKPNLLSVRMGR